MHSINPLSSVSTPVPYAKQQFLLDFVDEGAEAYTSQQLAQGGGESWVTSLSQNPYPHPPCEVTVPV